MDDWNLEVQEDKVLQLENNPDAFKIWLYELDLEYDLEDISALIEFFIKRKNYIISEILIDFKNEKGI